jgi:prepilin peptidase CpaA
MMLGVEISIGLGAAVAVAGAAIDARTGHIPNELTLGALAAAPASHFATAASAHGVRAGAVAVGLSLLGAAVCGLGPFLAFMKGGAMGGGDVKLLAAIGALLGPRLGLDAEFYGFVVGALYVPGKLAWHGRLWETIAGTARAAANPLRKKAARVAWPDALAMRVRLGPAIALGTLAALAAWWTGA